MALADPGDRDLADLPCYELSPGQAMYRAHRSDLSPWWFSSDMVGRFDLRAPDGTCYLAEDRASAVREVAGESLVELGFISAEFAAGRVVSRLEVPAHHRLADLTHTAAATCGITREISTCVPYDIPQSWARAIHHHRFDGIRFLARFSTGISDVALAIFGRAGQQAHSVDLNPQSLAAAAGECGIDVLSPPRLVTIVDPPGP